MDFCMAAHLWSGGEQKRDGDTKASVSVQGAEIRQDATRHHSLAGSIYNNGNCKCCAYIFIKLFLFHILHFNMAVVCY